MRISSIVAATLITCDAASAWSSSAFTSPLSIKTQHRSQASTKRRDGSILMSAVSQKESSSSSSSGQGRTTKEISNELALGVTLDGGPVIDFASVKDTTSRAEIALSDSRKKYEASGATISPNPGGRLMGINDEVVAEVGYEIGEFAEEYLDKESGETVDELVQKVARYLRSKSNTDTFPEMEEEEAPFTNQEKIRFNRLLSRAYEESGIVTSAFAKTFYLGTQVLPEPSMKAIWAIYVWCRRTDEIVDAPRPAAHDPNAEMLTDLSEWEIHMIRGMLMDIPGLGQERYDTWDELHLYCYRVAGTVGLMSMPVFGCAEGYTDEVAKEPALSLGVAFQITNILRDVGEDAEKRERVYLPQRDMERFGVTERQIFDKVVDENYINLMKFEIARARMYYARALRGVPMLRPESRLPVQLSLDAYGKILDKIEENGYDSLTKRAYVGKWEKLAGIPASWYRTLDIAKAMPLPGDWERPSLEEYEKSLEQMLENKWVEQRGSSATSDYLQSLNK
eukprot:g14156.t1 g14156   contig9:1292092-1293810(-)